MGNSHSRPKSEPDTVHRLERTRAARISVQQSPVGCSHRRPSPVPSAQSAAPRPRSSEPHSAHTRAFDNALATPIALRTRAPAKVAEVIDTWEKISAPAIPKETPVMDAREKISAPAIPKEMPSVNTLEKTSANNPLPALSRSISPYDPGESSSKGEQSHGAPSGFRFSYEPPLKSCREAVSPAQSPLHDADMNGTRSQAAFTLSEYPTPACAAEIEDFNLQPDPRLGLLVKLVDMDDSASDCCDSYAPVFSDSSDSSLDMSPTRTQSNATASDAPSLIVRLRLPNQTDPTSTSSMVRTEDGADTDVSTMGIQTHDHLYDTGSASTAEDRWAQDVEIADRARRYAGSLGTHDRNQDQDRRTPNQFRNMAIIRHFVFGEPPNQEYLSHISDVREVEENATETQFLRRSSSVTILAHEENLPSTSRRSHFVPPVSQPGLSEVKGRIRDSVAEGSDDRNIDIEAKVLQCERQRSLSY